VTHGRVPDAYRTGYRGEVVTYKDSSIPPNYFIYVNTTSGTGTSTNWKYFACT
jgi:hypothetical protein